MKKFDKRELWSIPNILSYLRIILIPVFCWLYLQKEYVWAAIVVIASGVTDCLDGQIARRCNMITEFGKFIDPVADKLTHAALALCLAIRYPIMWAMFALMVIKEGYMAIAGLVFLRRGQKLEGAMWFGKVSTTIVFIGMCALFLFPNLSLTAVNIIAYVMMVALLFSFIKYAQVYHEMGKQPRNVKKEAAG